MIRRFIFGCLSSLIMLVLLLGVALYFVVLRPIQSMARAVQEKPNNTRAYTPPASRRLEKGQVQRFMRVQRFTRTALGSNYTALNTAYQGATQEGFKPLEMLSAFSSAGKLLADARTAQARGLNQEKMSLSEYDWVKTEVYKSLGVDYTGIDLGGLAERFNGSGILKFFGSSYRVPPLPNAVNAALVRPFRQELSQTAPLALLGM
jgi:hypothetical protein